MPSVLREGTKVLLEVKEGLANSLGDSLHHSAQFEINGTVKPDGDDIKMDLVLMVDGRSVNINTSHPRDYFFALADDTSLLDVTVAKMSEKVFETLNETTAPKGNPARVHHD